MIEFQDHLYFTANVPEEYLEPWVTDGTPQGTHMLKDCYVGTGSSNPMYYTVAGDHLFFRAETAAQSDELWVTDGTSDGTVLVEDISPGQDGSLPSNFTEHNGELYFRAYPSFGTNYIYRSDGTSVGTIPLPQPTYDYNLAEGMCSHDGWLYFLAYGDFNKQLWRTDGTAAGTEEILYPGPTPIQPMSNAYNLGSCGGELLFRAGYIEEIGYELFILNTSVGIDEPALTNVDIFPNPTSGQLQVSGFPVNSTFSLYTTDGRSVLNTPAAPRIDVSELRSGPYVVRITNATGGMVHTQLLILQH